MEARKLQKVGERSFSVSLPKKWVLKNKLSSKDTVFIEEDENNKLCIYVQEDRVRQKKEITVHLEKIPNLSEFVVLCYVKNIDRIKFFWTVRDLKKINKVKRILKYLEGYDIVQETEKNIEVAFLFNDINITLPNTVRRMLHLLNLMKTALEEKDEQTIVDGEETIDRLYHLSRRILFSCLHNQKIRNENKISEEEEIIFYQDIVKKIEGIADNLFWLRDKNVGKKTIAVIGDILAYVNDLIIHGKLEKVKTDVSKISDADIRNELFRMSERAIDIFQSLSALTFNKKYF